MPKKRLALTILGLAVLLSAVLDVYFLRTEAAADVISGENEAYVFIGQATSGFHEKWIQYPYSFALESLGVPTRAVDERGSVVVIRVTPDGVERHSVEVADRRPGAGPKLYTRLEGRIWANYPGIGGLSWWATDHFEAATTE